MNRVMGGRTHTKTLGEGHYLRQLAPKTVRPVAGMETIVMVDVKAEWELAVERGPNWLLIRAEKLTAGREDERSLPESLWAVMRRHMTYRLVLELAEEQALSPPLIRQLRALAQTARAQGGCVRLCGMSRDERDRLRLSVFNHAVPVHRDRLEVVFGFALPRQPR